MKFIDILEESYKNFGDIRTMAKAIIAIDNNPDNMTEPVWTDAVKIAKKLILNK